MCHEERVRGVEVIHLGASYPGVFRPMGHRGNGDGITIHMIINPTPVSGRRLKGQPFERRGWVILH